MTWAFDEQAEAECRFGEPVVADDRAAADWWAVMTAADGSVVTIAGTSLLRFDGNDSDSCSSNVTSGRPPGRRAIPDQPSRLARS